MLNESSRRRDFPSLGEMTYLNTAAEGIPPQVVLDALSRYGIDKQSGMDGRTLHQAVHRRARQQVAEAYGMDSDEIAICSCTSEAYNLTATALDLKPGDEVIINDLDFPAGATPWLHERCPATVKVWRSRGWALHVEDLVPLLSSHTRFVTTSLVSFFNGHRVAFDALVDAVRKHTAALIGVDVTQALGRIPLAVDRADLVISSTHKWILASHGGGLVGVRRDAAERLTSRAGGWFHLENAFDDDRFERAAIKPGAASFAVGMPNYPAIYAIEAGLGYVQQVGVAAIDDHARPLVRHLMDELNQLDVDVITPDTPGGLAGIIALKHPRAEQIHAELHRRNIHVMSHAGRLRIAIHGYNSHQDIENLVAALRTILS